MYGPLRAAVFAVVTRGGSRVRESCMLGSERGAPSNGRPYRKRLMREWLEVHSESADDWLDLARESLQFVGT